MKRLINSLRAGQQWANEGLPLLLLLFLIPVILLMGFGVIALYQLGYLIYFVSLLTIISIIYFAFMMQVRHRLKKHQKNAETDSELNGLVSANPDWSEFDNEVWKQLNDTMNTLLQQQDAWEILREHALALVSTTANHYRPNKMDGELAFTLPELLTMTEEVSRRYRQIVLEHLPFAEQIHLSRIKQIYQHRDKTEQIEYIWNAYRTFRLFTPTGIISEIRSQITSRLLDEVKSDVQLRLKKAFLQEVASVAIDLYSGRFQQPDYVVPEQELTEELPALNICLIGQQNAGKSSLANLLLKEIRAEISSLPSTDRKQIYQLNIEGKPFIHLIDLPGLDNTKATEALLLEEAQHADLILWLLKANQPARALDVDFKKQLDALYNHPKMRSRKRPPLIGVLTQVDRLSHFATWQPPYSLDQATTPAEEQLHAALTFNRSLLNLDVLIPLSTSLEKVHWGIEGLLNELDSHYQDARQTQLNRIRLESNQKHSMKKEFKRVYRIGSSIFKRFRTSET